eukprot:1956862-Alexandrium_andersonii.AAC.1
MSASLVGSEMCIRDSAQGAQLARPGRRIQRVRPGGQEPRQPRQARAGRGCLLYTSDAADDM